MKIRTQLLKSALASLKPLFGGRSNSMIYSGNVRLQAGGGKLELTATNIDEWAMEAVPCDGDLSPVCVQFTHLACCLGGDEVEAAQVKGKLQIRHGSSVFNLATLPAAEFPAPPDMSRCVAQGISTPDVAKAIRAVQFAAMNDGADRPDLQCVYLDCMAKSLTAEASTGTTMAAYRDTILNAEFKVCIPIAFAGRVCDSLERTESQLRISDGAILVEHSEGWYWCKLSESRFPDTSKIWESMGDEIGEVATQPLIGFLESAIALTPATKLPMVMLEFSGAGLTAELAGDSEIFDQFPGAFQPHTSSIHSAKVLTALKNLKSERVMINSVTDRPSHLVFQTGNVTVFVAGLSVNPKAKKAG